MPYLTHEKVDKVISYQTNTKGIEGRTNHFYFQIQFFSQSIVKIQISQKASLFDFSYAIVAQPQDHEVNIQTKNQSIQLSTDVLNVNLLLDTFTLSFFNRANQLIQQDEEGLGIDWINSECTVYKSLQKEERFLGLGEKVGNLDRRGMGYTNWNTDYFAYPIEGDPLYSSIPFYIGTHNGLCYGIFLDSTAKTHFNFGASNNRFSSFSTEAGDMVYYFIYGSTVSEIIEQYTYLTVEYLCLPFGALVIINHGIVIILIAKFYE